MVDVLPIYPIELKKVSNGKSKIIFPILLPLSCIMSPSIITKLMGPVTSETQGQIKLPVFYNNFSILVKKLMLRVFPEFGREEH